MTIIVGLAIFVSILLVLVVLSQSSKGGMSANFVGAGASQMMGVKRTSDLLEKLTWGLAIALFILTISTNFMIENPEEQQDNSSINVERANESVLPGVAPSQPSQGSGSDESLLPANDNTDENLLPAEGGDNSEDDFGLED
jgi:preprotein translocase subunit SecG